MNGEKNVQAALVAAGAASLPLAYLGNRIAESMAFALDPIDGLLDAGAYIAADPIGLFVEPMGLIGALLGLCIPWVCAMGYLCMGTNANRAGEEHGSARWATKAEIRPFAYDKNPDPVMNKIIFSQNAGLALSRDGFSLDYDRNGNVLVIGGSGAGKTRYYVLPNVLNMASDLFITDPKGDLLLKVGNMLVDNGYEVASFNTFLPDRSLVYNPLKYVKTDLDILSFSKMLISMTTGSKQSSSDPFWEKAETQLYIALIAFMRDYLPPSDYNIGGLLTLMGMAEAREGDENYESPLDLVFKELETGTRLVPEDSRDARRGRIVEDEAVEEPTYAGNGKRMVRVLSPFRRKSDGKMPAYNKKADGGRGFTPNQDFSLENYKKFKQAAGKTLKSIIISCNVRLAPFTTAEVRSIVCGDDEMHLERMGDPDRKRAIFAIFKDTDQKTLGFLHGIMVYQAINILCQKALEEYGGRLPRNVNFILDEYRSLNLPSDISAMISVVRSRNISMSIIVQAISQFGELYEKEVGESIRGCCDTTLYLGGGKEDSSKFVSDSCGMMTVNDTNYSSSHGGQGSWSKSGTKLQRPLIDQAEVNKLSRRECIVMITGFHPFLDDKYDVEHHPNYGKLHGSFDIKAYAESKKEAEKGSASLEKPRPPRVRGPRMAREANAHALDGAARIEESGPSAYRARHAKRVPGADAGDPDEAIAPPK